MKTVSAKAGSRGWRVSMAGGGEDARVVASAEVQEALVKGSGVLSSYMSSLAPINLGWRLEFPKVGLGRGELVIGFAEDLADACVANSAQVNLLRIPRQWADRRSAALAIERRGLLVAGRIWRRFGDRMRFALAAAVALLLVGKDVLATCLEKRVMPADARLLFALHGEWSNRTKPLLQQLAPGFAPSAILVLGRPRRGLRALASEWQSRIAGSLPSLVRPFSIRSAVVAVPQVAKTLAVGIALSPSLPFWPSWHELIGMVYRGILGDVSAAWWRLQSVTPLLIVYGHTGLADSTALEVAQQAKCSQTVHVVHGVSGGLNFMGSSSIALFQCGHDADWHAQLGGYGQCRSSIPEVPVPSQGPSDLLLVSNLAHPMSPFVQLNGADDEACLLEDVASAVDLSDPSVKLKWKPHPAIYSLPDEIAASLFARARSLGFEVLPDDANLIDLARQSRYVVCSPSTVVVELLAAGVLPVLHARRSPPPGTALAKYPVQSQESSGLARLLASQNDESVRRANFLLAWNAIRPAAPLVLSDLASVERTIEVLAPVRGADEISISDERQSPRN